MEDHRDLSWDEQMANMQDLRVSIHESSLICPSRQISTNETFFLNNLDRALTFITLHTLHFFSPNPRFPLHAVSDRLRIAVQRIVDVPAYNFVAGRLNTNYETEKIEIDCNGAGVGLVVASSELSLDELGDLVSPNPAFGQLVFDGVESFDDDPLLVIQVTSFTCGSFAMGLAFNHALFDGIGLEMFLTNLASQAFEGRPLVTMPCNDRTLLNPRSPPRVTCPHPELKTMTGQGDEVFDSVFNLRPDYEHMTFTLSSDDISFLKENAKGSSRITKFNVVTALIWRCKALCRGGDRDDRESVLLYAADVRSRVEPPLPDNYCGNAVVYACVSASCRELEEGPFWRIVERVYEGQTKMTDEYVRSFIDWTEIHKKGYADGETLISSWWRLGFEKVEYPWGKPRYSGPFVGGGVDVILLTPEKDEGGGVNIMIASTPKEMEKFRTLFHRYLHHP